MLSVISAETKVCSIFHFVSLTSLSFFACSPSIEDISAIIQFISYCCTINLHTSSEHNQIVPLRYYIEEKVNVRSLVNEESNGMSVDDNWHLKVIESLAIILMSSFWQRLARELKWKFFFAAIFVSSSFRQASQRGRQTQPLEADFWMKMNFKACDLQWNRRVFQAWLRDSEEDRHDVSGWASHLDRERESYVAPNSDDVVKLKVKIALLKASTGGNATYLAITDIDRTSPADIGEPFWILYSRDKRWITIFFLKVEKTIAASSGIWTFFPNKRHKSIITLYNPNPFTNSRY